MRQVPSSSSVLERALGRRSTLALGLGAAAVLGLGLGGCDLDDLTGASAGAPGAEEPESDPDQGLVDSVLADLDQQLAAVVAARAATPSLRRALRPLEEMHRAHRAVLDPDTSGTATPSATPSASASSPAPTPAADPPRPVRTLRRIGASETAHQAVLTAASVTARSGALARVLASMSASVAQHLAVLAPAAGPS